MFHYCPAPKIKQYMIEYVATSKYILGQNTKKYKTRLKWKKYICILMEFGDEEVRAVTFFLCSTSGQSKRSHSHTCESHVMDLGVAREGCF